MIASWQPAVVIKQFAMVRRTKRLFQPLGAVLPNLQQTIGEIFALLAA